MGWMLLPWFSAPGEFCSTARRRRAEAKSMDFEHKTQQGWHIQRKEQGEILLQICGAI
jgi:hypothetical protein